MKKIIYAVFVILSTINSVNAQTTSKEDLKPVFVEAMLKNISQLDTASTHSVLVSLANNFERIGNAEKNKWEPFYYASYCYTAMAFMANRADIDQLADQSERLAQKAASLSMENSEISCLYAMINSCRIMVDPVSRFQTKGKEVQTYLAKATAENASNPRIYLLQARILMRTPEAFGGGVKPARQAIGLAINHFKKYQNENPVGPTWGEGQANAILQKLDAQ